MVSVLLMQRDTRKAHEIPQLLKDCGFAVSATRFQPSVASL